MLIANSNLVPAWANWDHFHELDRKGLMMYGQMTAGSWIYIGTQGIVQGTYETFAEVARQHYGGDFAGRWILTAGSGRHGRRPATGGHDGRRILPGRRMPAVAHRMRLKTGYLDRQSTDLDEALEIIARSCRDRTPVSVGLLGNAAEIYPELVRRGVRPDAVTDQTSAHDPVNGYLPTRLDAGSMGLGPASTIPRQSNERPRQSMAEQVESMLEFHKSGVPTFDYGNNIRQMAKDEGVADAFAFPGFVPAYIRPLFCRGNRAVPVGRSLWRSRGYLPDGCESESASAPTTYTSTTGSTWPARGSSFRACLPAFAGWAWRPPPAGAGVQRDGGRRRVESADRDRPRPSRLGLGRLAQPRNRGNE